MATLTSEHVGERIAERQQVVRRFAGNTGIIGRRRAKEVDDRLVLIGRRCRRQEGVIRRVVRGRLHLVLEYSKRL